MNIRRMISNDCWQLELKCFAVGNDNDDLQFVTVSMLLVNRLAIRNKKLQLSEGMPEELRFLSFSERTLLLRIPWIHFLPYFFSFFIISVGELRMFLLVFYFFFRRYLISVYVLCTVQILSHFPQRDEHTVEK